MVVGLLPVAELPKYDNQPRRRTLKHRKEYSAVADESGASPARPARARLLAQAAVETAFSRSAGRPSSLSAATLHPPFWLRIRTGRRCFERWNTFGRSGAGNPFRLFVS